MFRMMRRAPWIVLGAVGAYYLDGANGAARRRSAASKVQEWASSLGGQWQTAGPLGRGSEPRTDPPLAPSVSADRVRSRAAEPLAEEQAAGVGEPASPAMAQQILEESEERVTDRAGTAGERRRSEDTVEPEAMAGGR